MASFFGKLRMFLGFWTRRPTHGRAGTATSWRRTVSIGDGESNRP
jgi:hypothetical protein